MSIRNLDALFAPTSIAVLGATLRPAAVGAMVWRNLSTGFSGELYAVNPKYMHLGGARVYPDVASLPQAPALAVICTPPGVVAELVAELGARGTRAAVVITAGLAPAQKQAMLDAARAHTLRILGPNCLGMLAPHLGINASFSHVAALAGELAFVSQSGALVTAMLDWAQARGIGFSQVVSLGDHADVDFGDMLDFLGSDPHTRAILLYIESVEHGAKFMSAARAAARNKPVIVVKAGRSAAGQVAAASHTGALSGSDAVFDAAIARSGMLRVHALQDLFLAAETLSRFRDGPSGSLIVLTNGGGAGVMAADAAATENIPLMALSPDMLVRLDAVLPPHWSRGNPVDIRGDAPAQRYVDALNVLKDATDSAVLLIHAPTAIVPSAEVARALVPAFSDGSARVMGCWLGEGAVHEARVVFRDAGVPDFDTPEQAVQAFAMLRTYRRHQQELLQTPPARSSARPVDTEGIRAMVDDMVANGREWLTEAEAKDLLAAAGLPVVATRVVPADAVQAVAAADVLGYPVALKIVSPAMSHKSDVGGVRLNIGNGAELAQACQAMLDGVTALRPDAQVQGFTVQRMVKLAHGHELIVGASIDPVFGPVILFGHGGTAVEVLADSALALPPLNTPLALAQIARTRVASLLNGYRDEPAADLDAIAQVLVCISQLLIEVPELAELDINPLLVNHEEVVVLDARVRLSAKCPAGAAHFAIQPYPAHLVETWDWMGQAVTLRPIRPEDEAQHLQFLGQLSPEDIRLRVFYTRRSIEHSELARLTQIDYAREMALIATRTGADGQEETLGAVRATVDPDNLDAEFGVIVRSDLKGSGLGHKLMDKLIEHLRAQGTQRMVGWVLRENRAMLGLTQALGFIEAPNPDEPDDMSLRFVSLDLQ